MSTRFISLVVGGALAASAGSAFAFDAMLSTPKALRTQPSHRASVIAVIPANAVVDMARCDRGWCEAAYGGQVGFVYTPVLVSAGPAEPAPGVLTDVLTAPLGVIGGVVEAAPEPPPVVARY
jgi:uncharacterized protein YraI